MPVSKLPHIITGPPGSGKTTLINALRVKGYVCSDEVARNVIKKEQIAGNDGTPWGDVKRFSELVFKKTVKTLKQKESVDFSDRSLLDLIAYLRIADLNIPLMLQEFPFHKYYHKQVFFAPSWKEIYVHDPQRLQSLKEQEKIEEQLLKVYQEYGFDVCLLAKTSVRERVALLCRDDH